VRIMHEDLVLAVIVKLARSQLQSKLFLCAVQSNPWC